MKTTNTLKVFIREVNATLDSIGIVENDVARMLNEFYNDKIPGKLTYKIKTSLEGQKPFLNLAVHKDRRSFIKPLKIAYGEDMVENLHKAIESQLAELN